MATLQVQVDEAAERNEAKDAEILEAQKQVQLYVSQLKELHDKHLEVQKQLAEEIDKFNQVKAELVSFILHYLCCKIRF
jgi:peptidoglycan hydrolase CwlO-like protein